MGKESAGRGRGGEVAGKGLRRRGELGEAQGGGAKGGAVRGGGAPRGRRAGTSSAAPATPGVGPAPCAFPCKCATL